MAHFDFGVKSFEEFGRMTPGMFLALLERKSIEFKRHSYLIGWPTSAIYNTKRQEKNDKVWTPLDFVPQKEDNSRREELKRNIIALFGVAGAYTDVDMGELKVRAIQRLQKAGYSNVEEVFDEVFASWKKKT